MALHVSPGNERAQHRAQEQYCLFDTAQGACGIAWSERGVTRLQLPERTPSATERRLMGRSSSSGPGVPPAPVREAMAMLERYFAGERVDFATVAVDLGGVGPFHLKVYDAARALGWGQTASYGDLARQAGSPGAARAVGQAMGHNPVPIVIPCHRVLASGRKIGGFSAFGGSLTKQRLLALEGVHLGGGTPLLSGLLPAGR
jgi:methylated-DNA-[protein]-cysteine S-methyltransferase